MKHRLAAWVGVSLSPTRLLWLQVKVECPSSSVFHHASCCHPKVSAVVCVQVIFSAHAVATSCVAVECSRGRGDGSGCGVRQRQRGRQRQPTVSAQTPW